MGCTYWTRNEVEFAFAIFYRTLSFRCSFLEVNILWAAHQVHHSSEDYNLTTALRQSLMQGFGGWPFYLPMAFFVPPSHMIAHAQFNLLYQFWIHTEVVRDLGPL